MKIETTSTIVKTNNIGSSTEFKIKTSSMAFKILTDGLYSNKIGSMVRELICNAYDAHCAAGTQSTPIDIELPMTTNPVFRIRDYGTGLSEEDMKTTYTTYFESTKSNDNQYIGGFGLGSKTPLAYNTEQFFVRSYFNGKKYLYNVSIGENGAPTLTKWSEEDTTEPNGLELMISVNDTDIVLFKRELNNFLIWNDIKVNLVGYDEQPERASFKLISNKANTYGVSIPAVSEEDVHTINNVFGYGGFYETTAFLIKLGEVAYFVKFSDLKDHYSYMMDNCLERIFAIASDISGVKDFDKNGLIRYTLSDDRKLESLCRGLPPMCFKFDIGELEVTASRENLSFTKKTIDALITRIFGFLVGMCLKTCKAMAEAISAQDVKAIIKNEDWLVYCPRIITQDLCFSIKRFTPDILEDVSDKSSKFETEFTDVFFIKPSTYISIKQKSAAIIQNDPRKIRTIAEAIFDDDCKKLLKECQHIRVSNIYSCVSFKRAYDGEIRYSSGYVPVETKSEILDSKFTIVISHLSMTDAVKYNVIENAGLDTTGGKLYQWIQVSSKIAGKRLMQLFNENNASENKFFTYEYISLLDINVKTQKEVVKRTVQCVCFYLTNDNLDGDWKLTETYETSSKEVINAALENTPVFYVPMTMGYAYISSSLRYLGDVSKKLLKCVGLKSKKVLMAFVPSNRITSFETGYQNIKGLELYNISDKNDEYGRKYYNFVRHIAASWLYRCCVGVNELYSYVFNSKYIIKSNSIHKIKTPTTEDYLDYEGQLLAFCIKKSPRLRKWCELLKKRIFLGIEDDDQRLSALFEFYKQINGFTFKRYKTDILLKLITRIIGKMDESELRDSSKLFFGQSYRLRSYIPSDYFSTVLLMLQKLVDKKS